MELKQQEERFGYEHTLKFSLKIWKKIQKNGFGVSYITIGEEECFHDLCLKHL